MAIYRRMNKRMVIASFMCIMFWCVKFYSRVSDEMNRIPYNVVEDGPQEDGFLVNTPGCKIPDIDPFDRSISRHIMKTDPMKCETDPPITYVDGAWLRFNWTATLNYNSTLHHCFVESIIRGGDEMSDNMFQYELDPRQIRNDTFISADFIRIACYSTSGDIMYVNFHAFVQKRIHMDERCTTQFEKFVSSQKPKETLNILAIGVDAMSRLNFIRQMPKTRKFLLENMDGYELNGYNKVADNTFVNMVPMFVGKFVEELPWDESKSEEPFDDYNFIWKNFSSHGYCTLFAEDAPKIAIFNYNKEGFYQQPTDYYLRPMSLAMEDHGSIWLNDHSCVGSKLETEVVLDWVKSFIHTNKNKPFFSFAFITRLTHDDVNFAGAADEPHFEFLRSLHEAGRLNNTAVLYFSDHGARFGGLRETYVGKLEERLPAMYIALPKWFHQKYPTISRNLKINTNRLTTPFDIHATLADLLNFQPDNIKINDIRQRAISLFNEIPEERTCKGAGILPHWCTCHKQTPISVDHPNVKEAASVLVKHINKILGASLIATCEILTLNQILDARQVSADDRVLRFRQSLMDVIGRTVMYGNRAKTFIEYLITIRVDPSDALFEATVRYDEYSQRFGVMGDISRINRYGDQSSCMENQQLQKYCFCITKLFWLSIRQRSAVILTHYETSPGETVKMFGETVGWSDGTFLQRIPESNWWEGHLTEQQLGTEYKLAVVSENGDIKSEPRANRFVKSAGIYFCQWGQASVMVDDKSNDHQAAGNKRKLTSAAAQRDVAKLNRMGAVQLKRYSEEKLDVEKHLAKHKPVSENSLPREIKAEIHVTESKDGKSSIDADERNCTKRHDIEVQVKPIVAVIPPTCETKLNITGNGFIGFNGKKSEKMFYTKIEETFLNRSMAGC
ncbi:uncharacterized protein LOC141905547 [Tubulanus polymorphus]|uniref:uncharacterized protein LOC141905547 n=1 Tax=Tubulanus polymorphus TaxID=672921 RepID=UPI003DA63539